VSVVKFTVRKRQSRNVRVSSGVRSEELHVVKHLLERLHEKPVRDDKVAEIKAQIENGTYESPQKLDEAVNRLVGDLANSTF
jgi:anti-sigma28 factor (negative regulator of flagellin synthesis)